MKFDELPPLYQEWGQATVRPVLTVLNEGLEARLKLACQLICRSTEYDCRDQEMVLFIAKLQDEGLFSQPTGVEVVK